MSVYYKIADKREVIMRSVLYLWRASKLTINKVVWDNTRSYIIDFCDRYDYPTPAKDAFIELYDKIGNNPELKTKLIGWQNKYAKHTLINFVAYVGSGKNSFSKLVATTTKTDYRTVEFLLFLCLIPVLQDKYRKINVSDTVFYDSMLDFKCKLNECKRVCDIWGSDVGLWFVGFFVLDRFALGRLQFEKLIFPFITTLNGKKTRFLQSAINMHIPSSGPLLQDEVIDSFRKAYEFYRPQKDKKPLLFFVDSWLLNPHHRQILPPDSNIIKFMDNFKIFKVTEQKDNHDFWRIFGKKWDNKKPYFVGESSLQKGYAKLIRSGINMQTGVGAFLYDGETFIKK